MAALLVYVLLAVNAVVSLFRPWIGVESAYLIALLTPQNIWWWAFENLRPAFWLTAPAVVGFAIAVLRGGVTLSRLATRVNACVAILWVTLTLSYYFGPYVHVENPWRFYDPDLVFANTQKIFLTYFMAVALIDDTRKLKVAMGVMLITTVYMSYWANAQYFIYEQYGRLHGPVPLSGMSIYGDENIFAVLFVVGFPFLYYFGQYVRSRLIAWTAWLLILPAWHAVFLTASRGALIGIVSVLLAFGLRQKKRLMAGLLIAVFAVVFVWQAGDVMKERSLTITDQEDASVTGRTDAWSAAIGMMAEHPLTGVGLGSFGQAYPSFSSTRPRIAHNTFFQIAAENGVLAGMTYLIMMFSTLNRLRNSGTRLAAATDEEGRFYYCLNEACLLGLVGFFACSVFLSLDQFEVLYFLLMIANGVLLHVASLERGTGVEKIGAPPLHGVLERLHPQTRFRWSPYIRTRS